VRSDEASKDTPAVRAAPQAMLSALLPHVRVVEADHTDALLLKAQRFGLNCDVGESACAASFAQVAGLDEVVIVRTTAIGGDVLAVLSRVDGKSGGVVASAAGRASDVSALAVQIYGGPPAKTEVPVSIDLDPKNAVVTVDGRAAATEGGVVWVAPGSRAFAAAVGSAVASASVDVPSDGRAVSVALHIGVQTGASIANVPKQSPDHDLDLALPAHVKRQQRAVGIFPPTAFVGGAGLAIAGTYFWGSSSFNLSQPEGQAKRTLDHVLGITGAGLVLVGVGFAATGAWLWFGPTEESTP
jgi:hypothetical protein